MDKDPALVQSIEDVLDALHRMEKTFQKIDRNNILHSFEVLERLDLKALREAVEALQHIELDMRMTRIRIQALTGVQTPPLRTTTEDTPVEPIIRRKSSATFPRSSATDPIFPRPDDPTVKKR